MLKKVLVIAAAAFIGGIALGVVAYQSVADAVQTKIESGAVIK